MAQISLGDETISTAWDCFVEQNGGSHLPTSLWAQVKKPLGWQAVRLIATDQGAIVLKG